MKVDVVPAGPGLLDAGSLIWPESGYRMNLAGLRLAFEHHVRILAADELAGRKPGTPGIERAARYLAKALAQAGLEPASIAMG